MCQPFEPRAIVIVENNRKSVMDAIQPVEDGTPVVFEIFQLGLKYILARGFHGHQ
jgi:hypothetical protein